MEALLTHTLGAETKEESGGGKVCMLGGTLLEPCWKPCLCCSPQVVGVPSTEDDLYTKLKAAEKQLEFLSIQVGGHHLLL
jgi:hypothetical protein